MTSRLIVPALAAFLSFTAAVAGAGEPVDKAQFEKLRAALEVGNIGLAVKSVETSDIPGMYEVQFAQGPLVYATENGEFFLVGDLFTTGPAGYVNLTEKRRDSQRREQLAKVDVDDMIVFSPEGEPRAHVTVFTDVTCFYCQKLHKEVPELNKRGIEVRYMAYPRAGVGSPGFRQLASAWCADDPQDTLTRLKNKEKVAENVCTGNPVADQYSLGQQMGVSGTPAIITENGTMIPGYQPADQLIATLGLK